MNYYPQMPFNPTLNMQNRLNAMEQQYPQFAQNTMGINPQNPAPVQNTGMLKGRPVTGIDEAKAAPIDFDGSVHIFPDIANKKIYTKQLGMDGLPVFSVYELTATPVLTNTSVETGDFVSKEEFNTLRNKVEMFEQAILSPKKDTKPEKVDTGGQKK